MRDHQAIERARVRRAWVAAVRALLRQSAMPVAGGLALAVTAIGHTSVSPQADWGIAVAIASPVLVRQCFHIRQVGSKTLGAYFLPLVFGTALQTLYVWLAAFVGCCGAVGLWLFIEDPSFQGKCLALMQLGALVVGIFVWARKRLSLKDAGWQASGETQLQRH